MGLPSTPPSVRFNTPMDTPVFQLKGISGTFTYGDPNTEPTIGEYNIYTKTTASLNPAADDLVKYVARLYTNILFDLKRYRIEIPDKQPAIFTYTHPSGDSFNQDSFFFTESGVFLRDTDNQVRLQRKFESIDPSKLVFTSGNTTGVDSSISVPALNNAGYSPGSGVQYQVSPTRLESLHTYIENRIGSFGDDKNYNGPRDFTERFTYYNYGEVIKWIREQMPKIMNVKFDGLTELQNNNLQDVFWIKYATSYNRPHSGNTFNNYTTWIEDSDHIGHARHHKSLLPYGSGYDYNGSSAGVVLDRTLDECLPLAVQPFFAGSGEKGDTLTKFVGHEYGEDVLDYNSWGYHGPSPQSDIYPEPEKDLLSNLANTFTMDLVFTDGVGSGWYSPHYQKTEEERNTHSPTGAYSPTWGFTKAYSTPRILIADQVGRPPSEIDRVRWFVEIGATDDHNFTIEIDGVTMSLTEVVREPTSSAALNILYFDLPDSILDKVYDLGEVMTFHADSNVGSGGISHHGSTLRLTPNIP